MIKRLTSLKSYVTVWWDWLPTLQNIFLMLLSLPFPLWSEPCGPTDVVRKRREYKSNSIVVAGSSLDSLYIPSSLRPCRSPVVPCHFTPVHIIDLEAVGMEWGTTGVETAGKGSLILHLTVRSHSLREAARRDKDNKFKVLHGCSWRTWCSEWRTRRKEGTEGTIRMTSGRTCMNDMISFL